MTVDFMHGYATISTGDPKLQEFIDSDEWIEISSFADTLNLRRVFICIHDLAGPDDEDVMEKSAGPIVPPERLIGWECIHCHKINSPFVTACNCPPRTNTATTKTVIFAIK